MRVPRNNGMGHLTVVPQNQVFGVRRPLSGQKINRDILPKHFRVFPLIIFSCCSTLGKRAKTTLVNRMTHAFLEKARSPKFLSVFVDDMRMGAVNTVYFTFRFREDEKAVYLHVKGVTQKLAQTKTEDATITRVSRQVDDPASIETEILLLRVGKRDLI